MGISKEEQGEVWRMLGGVLALGNITFEPGTEPDSSRIVDKVYAFNTWCELATLMVLCSWLEEACRMLGCEVNSVQPYLIGKLMQVLAMITVVV